MENLLIMGINTRPMVNSALKLDYKTFSISYFKTFDFNMPYKEKHVLDQEKVISCGRFEDNYSPQKLFELFDEILTEDGLEGDSQIDKIVLATGLNASDFKGKFKKHKKIVRGNKNTEDVDNKLKFYNKIKNKFDVPLTFHPSDMYETVEILEQYPNNQFILKPLQGSGGIGIFLLNNETLNKNNHMKTTLQNISYENYILQEYIEGINVSSSVLSSHNDRKNLVNTRLVSEHDLGKDSFEYAGNILPLDEKVLKMFSNKQTDTDKMLNDKRTDFKKNNFNMNELNEEMKNSSLDLIKEFNLIGSNGVDYILDNEGELKVIEINPRFQGTYEAVEDALGINLLDAHIKACEGEIMDIPDAKQYSIKKIIYAEKQLTVGNLNIGNVYDIPYEGVKIEKNQPLVTLISSNRNLETAIEDMTMAEKEVYKNIA